MGKMEGQIDKILDEEFSPPDFDEIIGKELNYNSIIKRYEAAGDICERFIQFFENGK
jgi:hypothetical protein